MSTIKMTKTFEIPVSGDCSECKSNWLSHCNAFCSDVNGYVSGKYIQCQACIDFLKAELEKVYCDGCNNYTENLKFGQYESDCICNNKQEMDNNMDWYCNNCKDKEVIE